MAKYLGPKFNKPSSRDTKRNSLGIEGLSSSMAERICPVVANVTPRPFYWVLRCWCIYDLIENSNIKTITFDDVYEHVKRINFFLCLGSALADTKAQNNGFYGSRKIGSLNFERKTFDYIDGYLESKTQINYYRRGVISLGLIGVKETTIGNKTYETPVVSNKGKEIAIAFEKEMKKTKFYEYRFDKKRVPKDAIKDLGKKIRIDMRGLTQCKRLMKEIMFDSMFISELYDNKEFVCYIADKYKLSFNDDSKNRKVLYNYFSPRSLNKKIPNELKQQSLNWEIIVGRQYYTIGLEIIWKYMLYRLNDPMRKNERISDCINKSKFSYNVSKRLSTILDDYEFDYDKYELDIFKDETKSCGEKSIEHGISFILATYNRFKDRKDLHEYCDDLFKSDIYSKSSLYLLQNFVEQNKDNTIEHFIRLIMDEKLLIQHLETAFEKLPTHNGYFVYESNGHYFKKYDYKIAFTEIRIASLYNVLIDLDIIREKI